MSHLFLGWFGPRGLASVLFAFLVLEEHVPGYDLILLTVVTTVVLSVYLHGATAWPASTRYAARCESLGEQAPGEWAEVPELPARIRYEKA